MPGTLTVSLGERLVGTLANVDGDYTIFSFDEEYAADPARPILSQSFITLSQNLIRVVPRTHTIAPAFFSNLLPEKDGVLRTLLARQHGIKAARDFPFLMALGGDLPGSVVIRTLEARNEHSEHAESDLSTDEHPLRFSLAGVQLKFSASFIHKRLTIPLNGLNGSWIVKLPTNAYARLPENEFAVMRFAAAVGLNVPAIRLIDLSEIDGLPSELPLLRDDEPHKAYAIARFDRNAGGSRTHFEDFNQIARQQPAQKYEARNYAWIARVIRTLCPPEDMDEYLARLIFGIGVGNNDMHLKNWAIIYPDGRNARIAPMYDYVCTGAYFTNQELALPLAGEKLMNRITIERIATLANEAGLSVRSATTFAKQFVERMRAAWPEIAETIEDQHVRKGIARHIETVPLMNAR